MSMRPLIVFLLLICHLPIMSCGNDDDAFVPPPRFRPNPPYPPEPVDADGQTMSQDPYGDLAGPRSDSPTQPVVPSTSAPGSFPFATRTTNPNQVLSPYEPYNVIDVEGFKSGTLARDPSNQKIFRVP